MVTEPTVKIAVGIAVADKLHTFIPLLPADSAFALGIFKVITIPDHDGAWYIPFLCKGCGYCCC